MKYFIASAILLGAAVWGLFIIKAGGVSALLTWQSAAIAGVWLLSSAVGWHFLHHLPQGELDFDGEQWYFLDKTTQIEQVGTVSVRLDVQGGMLLRFESEFKRVSWLWFESHFALKSSTNDWYDLRRAVYSRPALQNFSDSI